MKQILSKSIVLMGLMGSGKSAIGKILSEKIGVPLSDTDKIIEEEVEKTFTKFLIIQVKNTLGKLKKKWWQDYWMKLHT